MFLNNIILAAVNWKSVILLLYNSKKAIYVNNIFILPAIINYLNPAIVHYDLKVSYLHLVDSIYIVRFPTANVGLVENMSTILEPKLALLLQKIFSENVFEILGKYFKAAVNSSKNFSFSWIIVANTAPSEVL